jgi:hypothetical protein
VVSTADAAQVQPEGYQRAVELRDGTAGAPGGKKAVVYQEKLHLLEAFGVLDAIAAAQPSPAVVDPE